ncbi:hypothetical protein RX909_29315, partial [Pseudomonas syringae pv. actinidiae]|nr:hypothetical protein [Pseudomonas syringae pv. actinidiae]
KVKGVADGVIYGMSVFNAFWVGEKYVKTSSLISFHRHLHRCFIGVDYILPVHVVMAHEGSACEERLLATVRFGGLFFAMSVSTRSSSSVGGFLPTFEWTTSRMKLTPACTLRITGQDFR